MKPLYLPTTVEPYFYLLDYRRRRAFAIVVRGVKIEADFLTRRAAVEHLQRIALEAPALTEAEMRRAKAAAKATPVPTKEIPR